jgi:glycerol-3-phosphate dehydrogenase
MKRPAMIAQVEAQGAAPWDVVVIGGGASGLGAALEAASRGFKTLLLEQGDFAQGTSSRSTKLIHGGVRYLAQGDLMLVYEALHERGLLMQNAPHLVSNQAFIIPNYDWWGGPFYTFGLKVYDMMAGKLGLGPSEWISREETIEALPNIKQEGLRGGVVYYDGQFDDARLAIHLARTIADQGGTVLNYMKVSGLIKGADERISGLRATDIESGREYQVFSKAVVNATGVFVDDVLKMDDVLAGKTTVSSQGVHLVLDKFFLPGNAAVLIPKTDDGRVLFAVPWYNKVLVGTTDTLVGQASLEPQALQEEIEFILTTAGKYLTRAPRRSDVRSVFAGLRPLVAPKTEGKSTKEISRGHKISVSLSGLLTMTGGKWTTYRKMGEDVIDKATIVAHLDERPSVTQHLPLHGSESGIESADTLRHYGTDREMIRSLMRENAGLGDLLHPSLHFIKAEVVWAVREEMARTIDDVLARRVRVLFLDAKASMDVAEEVGRIMAKELGWDHDKLALEISKYHILVKGYML